MRPRITPVARPASRKLAQIELELAEARAVIRAVLDTTKSGAVLLASRPNLLLGINADYLSIIRKAHADRGDR